MMKSTLALALALTACGADDVAPHATVKTATPDRLTMSDDAANDITITVAYDDGDGDLGGGIAEVHDCRGDALDTMLAIPDIASADLVAQHAHIAGTLDLYVNNVGAVSAQVVPKTCSDLGVGALADMQTVFCIVLVDASGHRGGGDCTKPVSLFP